MLYINSVDMESLTGPQAIAKAISETLAAACPSAATVVHFKVSSQGITLTDNQRKYARRMFPLKLTAIHSSGWGWGGDGRGSPGGVPLWTLSKLFI